MMDYLEPWPNDEYNPWADSSRLTWFSKEDREAGRIYFIKGQGRLTKEEAIAYYGSEELFDRAGEYGFSEVWTEITIPVDIT